MNLEMLAALHLQGLYLVPGVPNTTSKTQETNQSYGPFKSGYRSKIWKLSQAHFEPSLSLKVTDLPLLVFDGKCEKTGIELPDISVLHFQWKQTFLFGISVGLFH